MVHKAILEKFANSAHTQLTREFEIQLQQYCTEKQSEITERIQYIGFTETVEEAAYTWFNRIVTLRFFELHHFFPTDFVPEKIWQNSQTLQDACSILAQLIPQLFSPEKSYLTHLKLDFLFQATGIISRLLSLPSDDFAHAEIIGWLYQYYISSEHAAAIARKKVYQKSEIPIATQIFTPEWIGQYLVENTLGRFYYELTHDIDTKNLWRFYIEDDESIIEQKDTFDPCQITFLDPCCGSGHILAYAFEVFYQIYLAQGYQPETIPALILQNNLHSLEIDDRAAQLATIVVLLKARSYDPDIFQNPVTHDLNIVAIPESNHIGKTYFDSINDPVARNQAYQLFDLFVEAKNLGSLLIPSVHNFRELQHFLHADQHDQKMQRIHNLLIPMLKAYKLLCKKYHVVVTNPPYIKKRFMNQILKEYVANYFSEAQTDLFSAFVERCAMFLHEGSKNRLKTLYFGFMSPSTWLHTSQFQPFRTKILQKYCIKSLIQPHRRAFFSEASVQICAFVLKNIPFGSGKYFRIEEPGDMQRQKQLFLEQKYKSYQCSNQEFLSTPDNAILFWLDQPILKTFSEFSPLSQYAVTKQGMITGNNEQFIRHWFEVDPKKLDQKWLPHNKGGEYRKWYGNREYVIDWQNSGKAIKNFKNDHHTRSRVQNLDFNFRSAIGWSAISEQDFSARFYDETFTFNVAGSCCFPTPTNQNYLLGLLNSCVAQTILNSINPSLNYNVGDVAKLPVCISEEYRSQVEALVQENIELSRQDYDSLEVSRDFTIHPLLKYQNVETIEEAFLKWQDECDRRFHKVQANEQKLNQIFARLYHLENIVDTSVPDQKVTIRCANQKRDIKSLLSYFIGVICGRFKKSTDILFANKAQSKTKSKKQKNTTPIFTLSVLRTDASINYYDPDCHLMQLLRNLLSDVFSAEKLDSNLNYIAEAIGREFGETPAQTILRYFRENFFSDHVKTYHGYPIYWLFEIGSKHDFCVLAYCQQINPETLRNLRDTAVPLHDRYCKDNDRLAQKIQTEALKGNLEWLQKQKSKRERQIQEIEIYLEQLNSIMQQKIQFDFDQGVLPNYKQLQPLLAKLPHTCHKNL